MTLQDLKQLLTDESESVVFEDFLIFECTENYFLANQYIDELCRKTKKIRNSISSIYEPVESGLRAVLNYEERLNVVITDVFSEAAEDYRIFKNTIVVCKKIDTKIKKAVADFIVPIPKTPEWATIAFLRQLCPGIVDQDGETLATKDGITWLVSVVDANIYRALNEVEKINIFPEDRRQNIFNALRYDPSSDLCQMKVYELIDAIAKRDLNTIIYWYKHPYMFETDPIGLVTLLLTKFKYIEYIIFKSSLSAVEMGMKNPGQLYYINKEYQGKYTQEQLLKIIEFLSGIDLRLKNNELEMETMTFISYIISHVLAV